MQFNKTIIKKNSYFDSVTLMSIGKEIKSMEGVEEAVVAMATDLNKEILENVGFADEETRAAGANDFVIAVRAISEEACDQAIEAVGSLLEKKGGSDNKEEERAYTSIRQIAQAKPELNVAVLSVPGRYAAREAMQAMTQGMHVMMFSDNVTVEDERRLKEYAVAHGLLMMGPDCGTASINGVGLCFANKCRRGGIGIVAASGTGLQEIMVQVDRMGAGISQALGTGGRDLKESIGGLMMLQGIQALNADEETKVIVLVSKPPADSVARKIFKELEQVKKPVVVCFIDGDATIEHGSNIQVCSTLYGAAALAASLELGTGEVSDQDWQTDDFGVKLVDARSRISREQRFVRGLFCGGTLCAEAASILRAELGAVKSNVLHAPEEELTDFENLEGTVLLDMGDDVFTNGRPHPMIEPSLRNDEIVKQAHDPSVAVVLLDFEIGFGSHEDPVGATLEAIEEARKVAGKAGRNLVFVGYVCGTDKDKQGLDGQVAALKAAGVFVFDSNMAATKFAAAVVG